MTNQTNPRPVHYYDTRQHRIACGTGHADDHSTKHPRGVTCEACLAVVRERVTEEAPSADTAAATGV